MTIVPKPKKTQVTTMKINISKEDIKKANKKIQKRLDESSHRLALSLQYGKKEYYV